MTLQPFTTASVWNTPIGSGATFQTSAQQPTADLLNTAYDRDIAMEQWSHPIYYAASTDPLVTVTEDGGRVLQYRIPVGATPALPDIATASSDSHMHVVQPDGKTIYEAWLFEWTSSTTATAGYMAINDLTGDGITDGVRGYGGSAIGGLIRKHEIANRYIPHAIALSTYYQYMKVNGFVWPAQREDSSAPSLYHGNIGMGTYAAIPPSVNLASLGLSADGLALATALQNYGLYVVDSSQAWAIYVEPGSTTARVDAMWTDLPAIRAQVRAVTNNTSTNIGGGGTRRRPPAPRLALPASAVPASPAASPTVREVLTSAAYSGTTSSTSITTGAGTQVGDLLVAFGGVPFNDVGITTTTVPNAPTGTSGTWTNRGAVNRQDARPHLQIWTRPVTTAGAQTVTWGVAPTGSDSSAHLTVYVLSGAGLSVGAAAITIGMPANTSWPAPSVACAVNDLLLCDWQPFFGGNAEGTSTPPTIPASMSNPITTPVTDTSVQRSAREVITTGTTTGTRTATAPAANLAYIAGSITIRTTG